MDSSMETVQPRDRRLVGTFEFVVGDLPFLPPPPPDLFFRISLNDLYFLNNCITLSQAVTLTTYKHKHESYFLSLKY